MSVVAKLERRAEDAAKEAARLARMVELARELGDEGVAELVTLLGSETSNGNGHTNGNGHPPAEKAPRGREAIRRIVRERPGVWTLAELRAEMKRRGWFTSNKGVEVAVVRLCDAGECRRDGKGRYVFPASHGEEVAIVGPASGAAMIASP